MKIICRLAGLAALAVATSAPAGDIHIGKAYARPTVPGQTVGAVYLLLENKGNKTDELVAVSSPVSGSAEIHSMEMAGDVMKMREVGRIALKPKASLAMKPGGGYHIMLLDLKQPLRQGENFPLSLGFRHAAKARVTVTVGIPGNIADQEKKTSPHARH